MYVWTAIVGFGCNSDRQWVAADTEDEARAFIASKHPDKVIRGLTKCRPILATDQVVKPGFIFFCGFGVNGPCASLPQDA